MPSISFHHSINVFTLISTIVHALSTSRLLNQRAACMQFSEAISKCQEGLVLATANAEPAENDAAKVKLLLLRSSAYSGLSTWITSQSPSRSEAQPFYGQDPSHYALKAREVRVAVMCSCLSSCHLQPCTAHDLAVTYYPSNVRTLLQLLA